MSSVVTPAGQRAPAPAPDVPLVLNAPPISAGPARSALSARAGRRARSGYLEHLAEVRRQAQARAQAYATRAAALHPPPDALWQLTLDADRLWERRPGEGEAYLVRVGVGDVALPGAPELPPLSPPARAGADPVALAAAEEVQAACSVVPGQPLVVDLHEVAALNVGGPLPAARALVRALVAQAVAWHRPEHLRVAIAVTAGTAPHWTWSKWLPHLHHPQLRDAAGAARLFGSPTDLLALVGPVRAARSRTAARLLVVADLGADLAVDPAVDPEAVERLAGLARSGRATVVTILPEDATEAPAADVHLRLDDSGRLHIAQRRLVRVGEADSLDLVEAEVLARRLSPVGPRGAAVPARGSSPGLRDLLGLGPEDVNPEGLWRPRPRARHLRVPFAVDPGGRVVELDLKDSAEGGMGGHALVVGRAGSGKSELLRAVVALLATTHGPDALTLVLADLGGGATFAPLGALPHVVARTGDLPAFLDRLEPALHEEVERREALLGSAGVGTAAAYEAARSGGAQLEPLPSVVVAVDDADQLLAGEPGLAASWSSLVRRGLPVDVFLLLSATRVSGDTGDIWRALGKRLPCRLALRLDSKSESREVIGVPHAAELPSAPGSGYLSAGGTLFRRFTAASLTAPYGPTSRGEAQGPAPREDVPAPVPFTAANIGLPSPAVDTAPVQPARTALDVLVERLAWPVGD